MTLKDWLPLIGIGVSGTVTLIVAALNIWLFKRQERLKREMDKTAYEYQVRFSKLHEKRAEVIEHLWRQLSEVDTLIGLLVSVSQLEGRLTEGDVMARLAEQYSELVEYLRANGIYLNERLYAEIDSFCADVFKELGQFRGMLDKEMLKQMHDQIPRPTPEARQRIKRMVDELTSQFRALLGVHD